MRPASRFGCLLAVLAGLVSLPVPAASSADGASARVDSAVREQMREQKIPGATIAVVRDGKIIKVAAYGVANVELGAPARVDTVYAAGSITKQFTASAVMLLVEQGRVALEDSITKYFPEAPATWKPITIRQLLTHTSGIPDIFGDTEENLYSKGVIDFHRKYTEDELARAYFAQPLDFPPGSKWNYSNPGYEMLGFLVHRVTGQYYGDFFREKFFQPLGMKATEIYSYLNIVPNRASGYDLVKGAWKNTPLWHDVSTLSNAEGSLLTTVLDLAKWDAALYTDRILKQSSLETMWTPVPLDDGSAYPSGMGWFIAKARGHRIVFHTGGGFGFYAVISRYLDDRLTVIVMTNIDETHTDVLKIAAAIASVYVPETNGANPVKDWQD